MTTPTQRTLAWLRDEGYTACVVEKWIPQTKRRLDAFGFIDVLAIGSGRIIGVQATSTGNVASRVAKIKGECAAAAREWLDCGGRVWVVGWKRYAKPVGRKRWRPTVVEVEEVELVRATVGGGR